MSRSRIESSSSKSSTAAALSGASASSLSNTKLRQNKNNTPAWSSILPGGARRQVSYNPVNEWHLSPTASSNPVRKTKGGISYTGIPASSPALSPDGEHDTDGAESPDVLNVPTTTGSGLSTHEGDKTIVSDRAAGRTRPVSSNVSSSAAKDCVLFDDVESAVIDRPNYEWTKQVKLSGKMKDRSAAVEVPKTSKGQSSRAAERLASSSSPDSVEKRGRQNPVPQKTVSSDLLIDIREKNSPTPPPANVFGEDLRPGSRTKTSLESIRQQIKQIENELVSHHRTPGESQQTIGNGNPRSSENNPFGSDIIQSDTQSLSQWRPIQATLSSQSIPASLGSDWAQFSHRGTASPVSFTSRQESVRNRLSSRTSQGIFAPNNLGFGGMQRAHSVDVAVHCALNDIQNAVRRSSMVRLRRSTSQGLPLPSRTDSAISGSNDRSNAAIGSISLIGSPIGAPNDSIEEENDADAAASSAPVWIKRDLATQTGADVSFIDDDPKEQPCSSEQGSSQRSSRNEDQLLPERDRFTYTPRARDQLQTRDVGAETPDDAEGESESLYLLHEDSVIMASQRGDNGRKCDNSHGPSCAHALPSHQELQEGVLFRCCYLGSTHLFSDSRPTKASRLTQAQEAVARIKAPEGESQPMTEVELLVSTEKMLVLNTDIEDALMEHPLRTISYIADIGDLVVVMVKRGLEDLMNGDAISRCTQPRMLCHVFLSEEAGSIAQTIGQAFQLAYVDYLKANGVQDERYLRHLDYLEVLNSQEMSVQELELFASKDKQTNVVIPKLKGEILGLVIVESGWGSMLPTVIIANLLAGAPAARCGRLSVGDQLISVDGISLVGLPLAQCQAHIKNVKNHTVVKLTVVACPPVVEVRIRRPDTRYQLGFSVQNGIICSLLRGGIAERGGIRVGHRIIEINGQSVVAVSHENIVNMLAHSIGEITLKTMPSSIFRLLTGQDQPVYI